MKKQLQNIALVASVALTVISAKAQTLASIENLTLSPNSYWNGATSNPTVSTISTFTSGNVVFPNTYNGSWQGWESGWAYSNMKDSTTAGFMNQYSARTGVGYNNSANYVVAQPGSTGSVLKFNSIAEGKQLDGFYITNSTFAALSMANGDQFAKKFGGTTGNDPDWFKLKITKYLGGSLQSNDTVVFYLADFRFANNSQDYILKTWQFVDLKPLGNVDSLLFTLSSSDNSFGFMNTPSYFCADNFTTLDAMLTGINEQQTDDVSINIYPNPSTDFINVSSDKSFTEIVVTNLFGEVVKEASNQTIDISTLSQGVYVVQVMNYNKVIITQKIIKE